MWENSKDRDALHRLREEKFYDRAMKEISQGQRKDGLWLKAMTSASGDEQKAKLKYIELLVQSFWDEDHIATRVAQVQAVQAPDRIAPVTKPKPGVFKSMVLWILVALATLLVVFAFLPKMVSGAATFVDYLVVFFWGTVIHYSLKKLFPR